MIIPVRCFSCNKVIGNLWIPYNKLLNDGVPKETALQQLNIERYCCKRMIISHVETIDSILTHS